MPAKRGAKKRWDLIGLGGLAVVTVFTVAFAVLPSTTVPPAPAQSAVATPAPTPSVAAPRAAPASQSLALLKDKVRPWTLGVIGDSTGDAPGEWVHLVAAEMSARYDRPVVVHDWSIKTNSYDTVTEVGSGTGAPIVVWNGSAEGKDLTYAGQHKKAMVPERPDMLIVSHGHNVASAPIASAGVLSLYEWSVHQWTSPPAFAVTLQNPQLGKFKDRQDEIVATLRAAWTGSYGSVIDAYAPFTKSPPLEALLQDDLHPNPKGSGLWAQAVLKLLAPA